MNSSQPDQAKSKTALEMQIISSAKELQSDQQTGCYNVIQWTISYIAGMNSQNTTKQIMTVTNDNIISIELVGIYLDFVHEFSVVHNQALTITDCAEEIAETLEGIQSFSIAQFNLALQLLSRNIE